MRNTLRRQRLVLGVTFLLPAVLLYGILVAFPAIKAFYVAFTSWSGVTPKMTFVGLANFRQLLQDEVFWQALSHNVFFLIVLPLLILPMAVALAAMLRGNIKGGNIFRMAFFLPNVMSVVIVSVLWLLIYSSRRGLLNGLLRAVGLGVLAKPWLGSGSTALPALVLTYAWHNVGYYVLLLRAGIEGIPEMLYDAAKIDGAGLWEQFRYITLPLLWQVVRICVVDLVISVMGTSLFGLVNVMTKGGPMHDTEIMTTYIYRLAFRYSMWGYAVSAGLLLTIIIFVISLASFRLMAREVVEF